MSSKTTEDEFEYFHSCVIIGHNIGINQIMNLAIPNVMMNKDNHQFDRMIIAKRSAKNSQHAHSG